VTDNLSDPFVHARRETGIMPGIFDAEPIPMVLRHRDVRQITRDWQRFSSDAPFRVPIPSEEAVRSVRQLPIETDPPVHTAYRAIVTPLFLQPTKPDYLSKIEALVRDALAPGFEAPVEIISEVALPLQCRGLALLLGVPFSEAEEWVSWGGHVFHDGEGLDSGKGRVLDDYLDRAFARAEAEPANDFFSILLQAEFDGRPLTREEARGFANLAFAGGRDTVIAMIGGTLAHFGREPSDLELLRRQPKLLNSAAEELLRYLSPITHIGRVCPHGAEVNGAQVAPGDRISLCWSSANRDETVFREPDKVDLARNPNPHLAFGSGVHNCLGAAHARAILRSMLRFLADRAERLEVIEEEPFIQTFPHYRRHLGYDRLVMRFMAR
jgi:cytochrome P450